MANPHAPLRQRLEGLNLYLVGMMGSGKSTAGRHLAQFLGHRLLDAEHRIQPVARLPLRQTFPRHGTPGSP